MADNTTSKKVNSSKKIFVLLISVGILILILGTVLFNIGGNWGNISTLLFSIGGVVSSYGISWLVEEHYKKKDERSNALEMMIKIYGSLEKLRKEPHIFSKEKYIKIFRDKPLFFYYMTVVNKKKHWNCIKLDFTDNSDIGRLTSEFTIYGKDNKKEEKYSVEMFQTFTTDNIVIVFRSSVNKSRAAICILPCLNGKKNDTYGFMYHDDWDDYWRLSPTMLSFHSEFNNKVGWMTPKQEALLTRKWNEKYSNDFFSFRDTKNA